MWFIVDTLFSLCWLSIFLGGFILSAKGIQSLYYADGTYWFLLPIGLAGIALVLYDLITYQSISERIHRAIEDSLRPNNYTKATNNSKDSTSAATPSLADKETLNKWLEHNSVSAKSLIETKSDIEREIFFAHHLQDSETAKSVHRQFNKQYVWPARKKALQDEIEKSDLTTADKQMFADKLDSFGEEMSEQSVTSFSQELKKFQEPHIRKQNHIKYEGRLSNKDIQSIKEYHGCICMGCGLNPATEYGEQMKYMLEAHHKKPWGQMEENSSRVVSPEDFLILCPNCHKIIHKLESADDLETLQGIVRNK